jgi:hypothetical protein
MTRFEELTKQITNLYVLMDLHTDGRNVWRAQNIELARELDEIEEEADLIEQDAIDYREVHGFWPEGWVFK